MRTIITTLTLAITLGLGAGLTGCGGDDAPSCDKVTEHTLSLMPEEFKSKMGDKKALVAQCEKNTTAEDRVCAMAAKDMEGLGACAAKSKKKKS